MSVISRGSHLASLAALAIAAAWQQPTSAARFENLYTVTVKPDPAVANQSQTTIQAALARVLVRVTGNRAAPLEPALQPLIESAVEFRSSSGEVRPGEFQFGFVGGRIEQALTELGMPVWGPERPLTVLWVAVDDGAGGRALLGASGAADQFGAPAPPSMTELLDGVREEITAAADERGLPIAWPLLDLQDLGTVSLLDVTGGFDERIVAASARYGADAVLIGSVRPGPLGNETAWLFVYGLERQRLSVAGVRDGIDAAADRYAADLSTIGGASVTSLTIHDVRTPSDYGRVVSYLERQSVLERVDVESYGDGTLRLRVAARGAPQVLERVLALGGVLRPAAAGSLGSLQFEVVHAGGAP
jgi:hypothetical protein